MPSCSNSSNLLGNVNISNISNQGARLIMQHPLTGFSGGALAQISGPPRTGLLDDDGFTAGDVVRYDTLELLAGGASNPSYQKYVKAKANVAEHSEVIGVIESFSGGATGNEQVNIVLHGQIEYPSEKLANIPVEGLIAGASGGDDIYFLSEVTAGVLQNLAPSTVGTIAKPVLQAAADGTYTGHVINYIGYQIGGSVNVHGANTDQSGTVQTLVDFADEGRNLEWDTSTHWFPLDGRQLPCSTLAPEYNRNLYNNVCDSTFYGGWFGVRYLVATTTQPPTDTVGKVFRQLRSDGSTDSEWTVVAMDRANSTVTLQGLNINDRSKNIIPIDANKKLYLSNGTAYTIDTSTETSAVLPDGGSARISFALPYDTSPTPSYSFRNINGRDNSYGTVNLMYVHPDEGTASASFAEDISLNTVSVEKSLTIKNSAGTSTTTDVAQALKDHDTDLANALTRLGLTKTSTSIT